MNSIFTHKSNTRNDCSHGANCACASRARTFYNVAVSVGHALVVCLIFIDVLALRRLIVQPRTELVGIPTA